MRSIRLEGRGPVGGLVMLAWVYMLACADGRIYVGSHRGEFVDDRIAEHQAGVDPKAWTYSRWPVTLVWADNFQLITDAIAFERKLKGWSRAKKLAFARQDWARLRQLAKRQGAFRGVNFPAASAPSSFETSPLDSPLDEG